MVEEGGIGGFAEEGIVVVLLPGLIGEDGQGRVDEESACGCEEQQEAHRHDMEFSVDTEAAGMPQCSTCCQMRASKPGGRAGGGKASANNASPESGKFAGVTGDSRLMRY